jgi:peptidoglycan-associated lipoprotein
VFDTMKKFPFFSPVLVRTSLYVVLIGILLSTSGCSFLKKRDWPYFWRAKPATTTPIGFPAFEDGKVPPPISLGGEGQPIGPDGLPVGANGTLPLGNRAVDPSATREFSELRPIYFDYDNHQIRPDQGAVLDANANWLKQNAAGRRINIEGHCDERGTEEYNMSLSEFRASIVRTELAKRGVQAELMSVIPYGEGRPVDPGHSEEAWAKNRRVQFFVQ